LIEYFNDWKPSWGGQGVFDVSDAEENHEQESKRHSAIDDDGQDQNSRHGDCGIADFLAHMDCAIET
jgi:hypothetical protein